MNDIGTLLLSVCGLTLACGGLLAIVAFLAVRFLGFNLLGIINNAVDEDEDPLMQTPRRSAAFRRSKPLTEQQPPLDFDSAVQYYREQAAKGQAVTPPSAQAAPDLNAQRYSPPQDDPLYKYRQQLRRRDKEDDFLGMMNADDDDGSIL